MSLKHFHIFFIVLSMLAAFAFAAWTLIMPGLTQGLRITGWVSLMGGVSLAVYGVSFYRKSKSVIT